MELLTEFDMLSYWPFATVSEKGTDEIVESKCLDSVVRRGSNAIELKLNTASFGFERAGCSVIRGSELSELVVDTAG